jgi:hypothetical protein
MILKKTEQVDFRPRLSLSKKILNNYLLILVIIVVRKLDLNLELATFAAPLELKSKAFTTTLVTRSSFLRVQV